MRGAGLIERAAEGKVRDSFRPALVPPHSNPEFAPKQAKRARLMEGSKSMKFLTIFALVGAQLLIAAQPASAADLGDPGRADAQRHGAFAGARLRVPLGGGRGEKVRAGLTVAPLTGSIGPDGKLDTRFGEGMEIGFSGNEKAGLRVGGKSLAQLTQGRQGPEGPKAGTSTIKGLAIVGGVVVITLGALALLLATQ